MEECSQHSLKAEGLWFLLLFVECMSVCVIDMHVYMGVCILVDACVSMHVHMCMHVYVHVWRSPRLISGVYFDHSPSYSLR